MTVRAFRDEPSLAAGRVSGHHQILVIHAPSARPRLNAALISARWGQRPGEVPLLLSGAADPLGIQANMVGVSEHLLERQSRLVQAPGAGERLRLCCPPACGGSREMMPGCAARDGRE